MNRRLLDPFQSVELPDIIEEYLDNGIALCMAFNRKGTLLASGTKEGQVVIWDFDTRGVAAVLSGHEGAVNSVTWSRNGRFLLSGSDDRSIILWALPECAKVCRVPLRSAVLRVSLTPRSPHLALASMAEGAPLLVDLDNGGVEQLPLAGDPVEMGPSRATGNVLPVNNGGGLALFARGGELVVGCWMRGAITVVETASRRIVDVVRLPNAARVSDLVLNRKGALLLAACQDQRIRLFELAALNGAGGATAGVKKGAAAASAEASTEGVKEELDGETEAGASAAATLTPPSEAQITEALANKAIKSGSLLFGGPEGGLLRALRDFKNPVDRTPWRTAAFSSDCEHVLGASASKAEHIVFIWNRPLGNVERILEGPKESVVELVWHPLRSLMLSRGLSGRIYIWAKVQAENWSAFAPDFKELDENTEYVEREDEFDWNTPGAGGELGEPDGEEDPVDGPGEDVDILTREPQPVFSSDDEEEAGGGGGNGVAGAGGGRGEGGGELLYLPVVIEPVQPAGGRVDVSDGADGEGGEEAEGEELTAGRPLGGLPPGRYAQFPRLRGTGGGAAAHGGSWGAGEVGGRGKGVGGGMGGGVEGAGSGVEGATDGEEGMAGRGEAGPRARRRRRPRTPETDVEGGLGGPADIVQQQQQQLLLHQQQQLLMMQQNQQHQMAQQQQQMNWPLAQQQEQELLFQMAMQQQQQQQQSQHPQQQQVASWQEQQLQYQQQQQQQQMMLQAQMQQLPPHLQQQWQMALQTQGAVPVANGQRSQQPAHGGGGGVWGGMGVAGAGGEGAGQGLGPPHWMMAGGVMGGSDREMAEAAGGPR